MRSTFAGLEIGYRALQTNQKALEVTSHNLANSGNKSYSRQVATISATEPFAYPALNRGAAAGQTGTGVSLEAIIRVRDTLIDDQIRDENSSLGYWEGRQGLLEEIETIMNEPSDNGIREAVDQFWVALEELSTHPQEQSTRSAVRQQAISLADHVNHNYQQVQELRFNANDRIKTIISEINSYASRISQLNDQIGKVTVVGDHPNDLLDKRDELVEELSKLVNISTFMDDLGRMTINIGGKALVDGDIAATILAEPNNDDYGMVELYWEDTEDPVVLKGGTIKGVLDIRDQDLVQLMTEFDVFAETIITEINTIHQNGFGLDGSTGLNFFSGTGAHDIDISDDIVNDLNKIAASATGAPGNGEIALEMANIKHRKILLESSATMGEYIGGQISRIGVETTLATTKTDNQSLLLKHLETRKESVSGVSIDEEITSMMKYQHGYNAAAKIITTIDEMLEVIINGLKL